MPPTDTASPPPRWARFAVLALVLFTLFYQLGGRALNEPDEGRYAEVGREMMASGDWLTPRLNGIPHLSKPPLTYWCIAASLRLFGVNEFAARLPIALAALGTLLALYWMVREARDETTALWAVVMLVSSALFFLVARLVTADMLLTCWVTWSVWAIWRRSNWLFVFLALGVLTKGPVAVALPLFAMIGLRPHWRDFRWGRGLLVFFGIAAPWFVALAIQNPDLWRYFLLREVVQRVASDEHGRSKEWWFFFPVLLGGFLPWTFLVFHRRPLDSATRMFAAWVVLGLLLFSLSQSKLPTYVLPLMPPMAALAATAPLRRWLNALTAVALAAALVLLVYYLRSRCGFPSAWGISLIVLATVGALISAFNRHAVVATFLLVVLSVITLLPKIERQLRHNTSAKFFAERILRDDPQRQALVVCHRWFPRGLPFYLQSRVWWYHPDTAASSGKVFEFDHPAPGTPFVVTDSGVYRQILAAATRVFCVASHSDAERMPELTGLTWYTLERAGQGVLLSNRP